MEFRRRVWCATHRLEVYDMKTKDMALLGIAALGGYLLLTKKVGAVSNGSSGNVAAPATPSNPVTPPPAPATPSNPVTPPPAPVTPQAPIKYYFWEYNKGVGVASTSSSVMLLPAHAQLTLVGNSGTDTLAAMSAKGYPISMDIGSANSITY